MISHWSATVKIAVKIAKLRSDCRNHATTTFNIRMSSEVKSCRRKANLIARLSGLGREFIICSVERISLFVLRRTYRANATDRTAQSGFEMKLQESVIQTEPLPRSFKGALHL